MTSRGLGRVDACHLNGWKLTFSLSATLLLLTGGATGCREDAATESSPQDASGVTCAP